MRETTAGEEWVDCLCVGTGIIVSLEAVYQHRLGRNVLMIDRGEVYGGAWRTIEIDGIRDVENAVHYFLPDDIGIQFLRNELNWPIEKSKGKYRYFQIFRNRYMRFEFESTIGRFLHLLLNQDEKDGLLAWPKHFWCSMIKVLSEPKAESYYVETGAVGILNSMKALLSECKIEMRFNSNIDKLYFDKDNSLVRCQVGEKTIIAKSIILGHGARLPLIETAEGPLVLEEKFHPRPAFHLVVEDNNQSQAGSLEIIFEGDPLIKYVHDISRFSSLSRDPNDKRKVFVFALQSHVHNYDGLADELCAKLENVGVLGQNPIVTASYYSDIILPTLYDDDLDILKKAFGDLVNALKTESFSSGVGYNADRWQGCFSDDPAL